ncbi:MAG: glycosyltransferase family 1 protein [Ardenticatenia bacterium]|nr:glycosyltransferase family 1 protein [Ardenticatenia bacterium]
MCWEPVRRRYHLPPRFVLYVGTLEPRKNLVRLVKAFARVRADADLPHHLVLVGQRGWKDVPLFAAIENLGVSDVVHVVGYVPTPDVVALYNLAELFVFPSVYEGFGLPIVEAMACGTPVLTSAVGAMAEIAGGAAELVNPLDVGELADALHCLLTDRNRRRELRRRGLRRAAEFSWRRTAEETAAIYRLVLASSG